MVESQNAPDLVELLERRAAESIASKAFTFLVDGERKEEHLTYGELRRRARAIASLLQSRLRPGARVVLLYPPGLDYISAFFGCLAGGFVAVPAYPPNPARLQRTLPRLQAIVSDAQADVVLTTSSILGMTGALAALAPDLGQKAWLATDMLDLELEGAWKRPDTSPETLAFLQYTSGSTGNPKGVMLTHRNLLANERMIQEAFDLSPQSIGVGWLPLYHDMGLIGNVIQPIYAGFHCILMSPLHFLERPLRWLEAISRYRGTASGGPNFAYDLCVRKSSPEERERLDLRSWKVAFSGAEPVRAETLALFARTFEGCGFAAQAFLPCFGLAEASLLVTGKPPASAPGVTRVDARALEEGRAVESAAEGARSLVGVGRAPAGTRVLVVDPVAHRPCPDGRVGEIWVSGPHVAVGYWGDPEKSASTFGARLSGDAEPTLGDLRFLRTGDLGFLRGGELTVCGRLKDLIILRGRNYYPQDFERSTEESHPALRRGCSAAFSVEVDGEERLVVAVEVDQRALAGTSSEEIFAAVRGAIAGDFDVHVHALALLTAGSIPKTSSGKIQRQACRGLFLEGSLGVVSATAGADASPPGALVAAADVRAAAPPARSSLIEGLVRAELSRALRLPVERVDMAAPLSGLGLDSLMAVELSYRISERLAVALPVTALLGDGSAKDLAATVLSLFSSAPPDDAAAASAPAQEGPAGRAGEAGAPLSAGQEAMWFLQQLAPESSAYNLAAALRIKGELSPRALEGALRALVARHAALHTTYAQVGDRVVQRARPELASGFRLEVVDASSWSDDALAERLSEAADRPFDLTAETALRAHLFVRSEGDSTLVLAAHHIATDLWSIVLLMSELRSAYPAVRAGRGAPSLATPRASYGDFVAWQQRYLATAGEADWAYWQVQLAKASPLELPTDRPRPAVQTYRGAAHRAPLDPGLVAAVAELARREGVTPYVVLLAAFEILLSRYSGQSSFLIGSPVAGRPDASYERAIGYFVNPLPMLADTSGDPSVRELVQRVRRTVLGALERQRFPFALQVQRAQGARDASRSPLFQVMFVLEQAYLEHEADTTMLVLGAGDRPVPFGGMELWPVPLPRRSAQFDLTLSVAHAGGRMSASFEYNTDLFDRGTIERMAGHFEVLLRAALAAPHERVRRLPLMPEAERRQVLEAWNATEAPYAQGTLHGLFEAQARRTPDATALVSGTTRLSYRELDARANGVAQQLVARGVKPEQVVPVMLERGADLVVALLGVLKSGAAYAPIDPAYPRERVGFVLEDTDAPVVLTQASLVDHLAEAYRARAMFVTDARASSPARGGEGELAQGHRAYIIYTSGSTGRPKGVDIEHRSAVAFVSWAMRVFGPDELEGVLAATSVCFDLSIFELFVTLAAGGKVLLAENALALPTLPARDEVTLVNTVPSAAAELLRCDGIPRSVRTVNLAGEPLPAETVAALHALPHVEKVYNLYGPSEDTTYSTYVKTTRGGWRPTIGRPIENTRAYVLDAELEPVAIGVAGEVYLSGAGLARGYLNRAKETAARFLPDPFSEVPGARMYRTGDVARYLPDGNLEFLGRTDHQVKVRGFRIELGEIESALRRCAGVRDAVVVARGDAPGTRRLVAYVTGDPHAGSLREQLRARLPEYMVPSGFVVLESLPLTPSGKVDRRSLPEPDDALGNEHVAPRTAGEERLVAIWRDVLRAERVGVTDNFFELGGHSLLATQVVSRIRRELGVEVPLRALFEAPTVELLAARLGSEGSRAAGPAIVAAARGAGARSTSFAQERLWFLDQLEPESVAYNIPMALRIEGRLDVDALARSVLEVTRRHESLRTTFAQGAEGEVVSVVHAEPLGGLEREDLRGEADGLYRVRAEAEREARTPFDLKRGPLLRARLLSLSEQEHVLLLTLHHIVSDGWSLGVLVREVTALYEAFAHHRGSPLAPLSIQYADYAAWQRAWLSGAELEAQRAYWKGHLAGAPAALELPTDRPRPAVQSYAGATVRRALGKELSERVDALSHKLGATPFMTLLAGFSVLLGRYSNQRDIVVGTPIANRTRAETEPLIGLFVNTLAVRTDLSGEPTFVDLLGRVKQATLGAYAHQDLPFERVVEALNAPRDLSRSPVFQVMFALQNAPAPALELAGLTLRLLDLDPGTSKFDLMLDVVPTKEGYVARWEFNSDLFDPPSIERLASHFINVLDGALSRPDRSVYGVPILSAGERRSIVKGWNATRADLRPTPVHALFEETARRLPDVLAVLFDGRSMTYAELHRRSNRFARHLQKLGVEPHSLVGMCLERSLDVPVAVLAILKAGAACVPMDASYPSERLRFMAEDSRAPVVVTQTHLRHLVEGSGSRVVCMDDCAAAWAEPDTDLAVEVGLSALCYVIYTSGSTGRPKGAALPHLMLTNLIQWQLTESTMGVGERTLQFSPLSFDVCYDELFSTWASGGTLVLVSEETRRDPARLLEVILRDRVARLFIPFVALQGIAEAAREKATLTALREIVCGGEQLQITPEVVELHRQLPGSLLHNQYGPTESHFVTAYRLTGDPSLWPRLPPIGKPMFNTQMYVLDARLEPVPVGVRGDLYIAGVNLARCYWQRGDLTAERFVPDPFSDTPGARMYRTGDVARYLPDGNIEFLGRSDYQVKVRGFRIELAEIEQALMAIESVGAASAVVREDRPGLKRLIGYVVPRPGAALDARALRAALSQRLPEYMVPSGFVVLESLPLTPSGKVDRRSLPEPEEGLGNEHVAPRTAGEERLVAIWRDVLRAERVGVTDNFFELGGHSLLATQVVSRIRRELGVEVPLRALFEAPTVELLAARLGSEGSRAAGPAIVAAARGAGPRSTSFAQERLWFLDQLEPESVAYNIPMALRIEGRLDVDALARSVHEVTRRHESLRTTFAQGAEGEVVSVVHAEPLGGLACEDLRGEADGPSRVRAEAEREARTPFDLKRGPLLRARLLSLSEQEHVLLLTLHHIVSDGWSLGVLVREVTALYEAFAHHRESPLAPLSIQYADYAAWQRAWLSGAELEAQRAYWKGHLAGAPAALELPTDRPRPAVQSYAGATVRRALGKELSERVDALSHKLGATPFMTLLAGFSVLLGRYSNQRDIVVGTPIANRTRAETEPLIGLFVNTLAVRTDLSGEPTFVDLLGRVKQATLGAYAHQDLPFERVVEALNVPRDLSRSPVFQVMFALQNTPAPALELAGLEVSRLDIEDRIAKFDLSLHVAPGAQGYVATWELNTTLFERESVERMAAHFAVLLRGAVLAAERPVAMLPLLDAGEERRLLSEWSATEAPFDAEACIHDLFEAQARRAPDAVAVTFRGESLTYRQLDARANRVAARLRELGVGPDVCVGVCMDRSIDMLAALLGTLKAGGAYVPMDPSYPRERLAHMLEDSRCQIVVTDERHARAFQDQVAHVLRLDVDRLDVDRLAATPAVKPAIRSTHLAYVIFTSGSTGRPKGVQITHQAVVNFLTSMAASPGIDARDVLLAVTSISFDIAALELFLPLVRGAKVVLADRDTAADGRRLVELARSSGATIVQATPATYWLMIEAGWPSTLRFKALCGGEALSAALSKELRARAESAWNMYGPTETTIWSTSRRLASDTPSIGRPIANTTVRVLDGHGRPCPVGVAGELHIGGVGVARGYLGRADLTAERFVPDPYAAHPGARLYRTGDLVRWRADGELEFLGRIDHQVKVRGFRIELGEIETALASHPRVRRALAVVREDAPGDKRLVAYVVADEGETSLSAALRSHLALSLPEYMIPTAFVTLDSLPLTPNGKVDRKALPAPELGGAADRHVAPADATEEALVRIWQEVLKVERVGMNDNFFELGGHSLLATQLVDRIGRQLGRALSLKDLFEAQTPAGLLSRASAPLDACATNPVVLRSGASRPLFLVHAIGGGVSEYVALAREMPDGQAVLAFQARGLDGSETPNETVEAMASQYIASMRGAQQTGPLTIAGWSMGGVVAFEMACQLEASGHGPNVVVLLDPPLPEEYAAATGERWALGEYLADLALASGRSLPLSRDELTRLVAREERDALAVAAARREGIIPQAVTDELLRARIAVFEANQRALRAYRPRRRLVGDVVLLRAQSSASSSGASDNVWTDWIRGAVTIETVPGDHYSMLRQAGRYLRRFLRPT
ncbi:amino acid adenylation domain-containing protein [Sorangium sp. So ce216]